MSLIEYVVVELIRRVEDLVASATGKGLGGEVTSLL